MKMKNIITVAAVLLLMLTHTAVKVRAADPASGTLNFAWPAPSSAWVTQSTLKKGKTATIHYRLNVEKGPGADELTVGYQDFSFLSLNGEKIETPAQQAAVAPALAMSAMVPSYVVGPGGQLAGFKDFDFEAMLDKLIDVIGPSPELAAVTRQLRNSPQMREMILAGAQNDWLAWVGAWTTTEVPPREQVSGTTNVEFAGNTVPSAFTLSHHGSVDECQDCVRLTMQTVMSGPNFRNAMKSLFQSMGLDPTEFESTFESLSRVVDLEVVTSASTMQPMYVSTRSMMRLTLADGKTQQGLETKDYRFEWQ